MARRWSSLLLAIVAAFASGSVVSATHVDPMHGQQVVYRQGSSTVIGEFRGTWPDEAKAAFGVAASIVAATVAIKVPVVVSAEWTDLGSSTLGRGGPEQLYFGFSGAPKPAIYYPSALAQQYVGSRLDAGIDVGTSFNSTTKWYYGSDARPATDQSDFVTTVVHEILHGMGFLGTFTIGENGATWGDEDGKLPQVSRLSVDQHPRDLLGLRLPPTRHVHAMPRVRGQGVATSDIYDQFLVTGRGERLLDIEQFPKGSDALRSALTNADLYWGGPAGVAANGGNRVKLYAPDPWSNGSSVSHLDDATFDGTPDAILTSAGEKIRSTAIGPVVRAMLADMGWTLTP